MLIRARDLFVCALVILASLAMRTASAESLPWIRVSEDHRGFVQEGSGKAFRPLGFNYDHDPTGCLIEDYWDQEWRAVEASFRRMKQFGANVIRIHLQFGKFMKDETTPNQASLDRLSQLLKLAEDCSLYIDLTGLGCYHKKDVPSWYDKLDEAKRWNAQAYFWRAVASTCAKSPAIFCYDLMNEPVVPGGRREDGDWLGPDFVGKHFVQFVTLDQRDRPRPEVAKLWIHRLVSEIKQVDTKHMITVGLVDWSLDRPGLSSGFVPEKVASELDFVCVHLYPQKGKVDEALKVLEGFAVGKPVLIEETFPLACPREDFEAFVDQAGKVAAGWISFYWGKPPEELKKSSDIGEILLLQELEIFEKHAKALAH
ncbi:cellulase family glycosylhydrolase [Singulisphaera sp. PoT]|uniref:cellulase family glycosylhydrolase n=1 Tax=Singulisphaera sp. PoT TaxID=3411797 RepID=UPI003BF4D414